MECYAYDNEILELFGRNLRAARINLSLTPAELADRAGISRAHLLVIEQGELDVPLSLAAALAGAVECLISELLMPRPRDGRIKVF